MAEEDIFHQAEAPRSFPNRHDWHEVQLPAGFQVNVPNSLTKIRPFPIKNLSGVRLINRWGQILKLDELRCGNPWELYVEAFNTASLKLFLSLVPPGLRDIQKARLGHSYNCGFRKLFKNLQKFDPVAEGGELARKSFIFQVEAAASRVLWYYFLADAFTEFVFNWESAVIQRQQCNIQPNSGPCQLSNGFNNSTIANAYLSPNFRTKNNDPDNWAPGGGPWAGCSPHHVGAYRIYAGGALRNGDTKVLGGSVRISDGSGLIIAGPQNFSVQPGAQQSFVLSGNAIATVDIDAEYNVEFCTTTSTIFGMQWIGGTYTCVRQ